MKLTKISQARKGFFIVEVRTDKKGNYKRQIIRGGGGTKCNENSEKFLDDLFNADVPGFGQFGEVTDAGHTTEYYEQNRPKPQSVKVPEEQETIPIQQAPEREKMGLGYGT